MHKRKNPDLIAWQRQSPANAVFWWGENERRAKQMVEDMFIDIPLDKKLLFLRLVRFEFGRAVRLGLLHPHLLKWINVQCDLVANKRKAAKRKANSKRPPGLISVTVPKEMYEWLKSQPQDSIKMSASVAIERYSREFGTCPPKSGPRKKLGPGAKDIDVYVSAEIQFAGSKAGAIRNMIKWAMEQEK